jgi:hypothetical protein
VDRRLEEYLLHDFPDRAIRRLLENPRNLREVVADLLPDLADRFDFAHVEPVRRDFLLEDWRRRESDLFFRLPFRTDVGELPSLVCVLIEHQSAPDPVMPLRILTYAVLYWDREWKSWNDAHKQGQPLRLTPVIPIVFHTGSRRWETNRDFTGLMACPDPLRQFVPHWPILFWDLAERSVKQLLDSTGDWLRALAVVRAEREEKGTFATIYGEVLAKLELLAARENVRWHDLMEFVLSWAFRRRPKDETEELKTIAAASHKDRQRKKEIRVMSTALGQTWEQWALEVAERRRAEGKAEGKVEGEIEARREDLLFLLKEKFGKLPASAVRKINTTSDSELLKAWIRQVVHIDSLDELGI